MEPQCKILGDLTYGGSLILSFHLSRSASCGKPVTIANGNAVGKDFRHNKRIRYTCNAQYVLNGNSLVTCVDGKWNSTAPNCRGKNFSDFSVLQIYRYSPQINLTRNI